MFGRFLELAIATQDILSSVQFYERLGFAQHPTGDAWPHRYGVLADERVALGLHERELSSPASSFVLPELAHARSQLLAAGITPEYAQFGEDSLHFLRLRDPGGHAVVLQEARSFSPGALPGKPTVCGYFAHLSLPQSDLAAASAFWETGGMIALPAEEQPYGHVPLTSDGLDLALHARAACAQSLLVFESSDLHALREQLRARGLAPSTRRLPGLSLPDAVLLEAPEGTQLLMVQAAPI